MAAIDTATREIRLVFADEGEFHTVTVRVSAGALEQYDRLIDLLREDPDVTRQLYVDVRRLVTASVID